MVAAIALPSLTTVSYSDIWRWCAGETGLRTPNGLSQSHLGQKFWSFCALVSLNLLFAYFSSAHLMFQQLHSNESERKAQALHFIWLNTFASWPAGLSPENIKQQKFEPVWIEDEYILQVVKEPTIFYNICIILFPWQSCLELFKWNILSVIWNCAGNEPTASRS